MLPGTTYLFHIPITATNKVSGILGNSHKITWLANDKITVQSNLLTSEFPNTLSIFSI